VGVVVAGDDGATAVDGTTGAARWTFRRVGAGLTDLLVSPDRRTVVTIHAGPAARAAVLTVLDATTGERRWELATDRKPVALLTDGVLAVDELLEVGGDDPPRSRTTARDIGSGAVLWTWEPPPGCDSTLLHPAVSATVVPVETSCQDGLALHGLDGRTGSVTWTLRTRPFDSYSSDPLRATPDGTRLVAAGAGDRVVVDTATGTPVGRIPYAAGFPRPSVEGRIAVAGGDPERVVAAVDPASGALQPVQEGCRPKSRRRSPTAGCCGCAGRHRRSRCKPMALPRSRSTWGAATSSSRSTCSATRSSCPLPARWSSVPPGRTVPWSGWAETGAATSGGRRSAARRGGRIETGGEPGPGGGEVAGDLAGDAFGVGVPGRFAVGVRDDLAGDQHDLEGGEQVGDRRRSGTRHRRDVVAHESSVLRSSTGRANSSPP
jgi:PQQ-like domain